MRTVYKYPLNQVVYGGTEILKMQDVQMPLFSKIIHVGVQYNVPTLWVETDPNPNIRKEARVIRIYATGELFDADVEHIYIGTIHNQGYVFHIYEQEQVHE